MAEGPARPRTEHDPVDRTIDNDALLRLDQQFCFAAYALSRAVVQAYDPLLQPLGLTYPQYLVMLVLWEEREVTLKTIGEALFLDSGTLTPLVKRLETKGFVTRRRSAKDERSLIVTLTPEGKRLKKKAVKIPEGLLCRLDQSVSRVTRLRDDMKQMLQSMQTKRPYAEKKSKKRRMR